MMGHQEAVERSYEIPGQTWPAELLWLYDNLAASKSHAEIGVYCGRSLFASCGGMTDASVYAVDLEHPSCAGGVEPCSDWFAAVLNATFRAIAQHHPTLRIEYLRDGSLSAARALYGRGVQLDSLFIDGGHEYEHAVADMRAWPSLLKPGGLICGHDFWPAHPGVMRAVHENFDHFEIVPNTRIWFARLPA
jgi:hypothetical protein